MTEPEPLSDRDRRILAFERAWWDRVGAHHVGPKQDAIRAEFEMSPARYYQRLNRLLATPAALALDPVLVNRLIDVREGRRTARSAKTFEGR